MTLESAALSAVIGHIYDAAIDATLWPKAMQSSCDFIGGRQSLMFWHDAAAEQANALYLHNDDPHFTRLYLEKYVAMNPVFPAAMFSDISDVGNIHGPTDIVPKAELEATRFFQEWVKPQGITGTLAVALERELLRAAYYTVHWHDCEVGDDARDRMALLVPHLQRAVAIGRLFVSERADRVALTETLNRIETAVILVTGHADIVFANVSGQRLLDDGKLLRANGKRLAAIDSAVDHNIKHGVRRIAAGEPNGVARGITLVLSDAPDHRWIANVLPLVDGARKQAGEISHAVAAIFVRNSQLSIPTPLETLARSYDLTASEIRVVDTIVKVSGIRAIAEALGISESTVKTHLQHIYRKCDVGSQRELIKLIAGLGRDAQEQ